MKRTVLRLGELAITQVAIYAFPMLYALVCARVLGASNYGILSFYAALATFLAVIVDFGFDWYGIREVARSADRPGGINRALWSITFAKLLLVVVIAAGIVVWCAVRTNARDTQLRLATLVYLTGFATDTSWFLRALEHTRLMAKVTVVARLAGVAALATLVSSANDTTVALWIYAFVAVLTSLMSLGVLVKAGTIDRPVWDLNYIARLYRGSCVILFGNLAAALVTNGGVAVLGLMADPITVGAANLALRVKMAGQAALVPIRQLGYVRITALAGKSPSAALSVARRALAVLLLLGAVAAAFVILITEPLVSYLYRGPFVTAAGLMILLAITIPVNAAANLFGMQALIAFGKERGSMAIQATASVSFCIALLTVPGDLRFGWAVLTAEVTSVVLAALILRSTTAALRRAGPSRGSNSAEVRRQSSLS